MHACLSYLREAESFGSAIAGVVSELWAARSRWATPRACHLRVWRRTGAVGIVLWLWVDLLTNLLHTPRDPVTGRVFAASARGKHAHLVALI
jgi:hypothetical protein